MSFNWFVQGVRQTSPVISPLKSRQTEPVSKTAAIGKTKPGVATFPTSNQRATISYETLKTNLLAKHVMTEPVVTLQLTDTFEMAWELVCQHRFRHVPILEPHSKKLYGIVSDRDLLKYQLNTHKTHSKLENIITAKVLTALPETKISEVVKKLFDEKIGSMPIINDNEELVGIITRSDILHALITHPDFDGWI